MNPADIAQALLQLTGSLTPASSATDSDLAHARSALAQTLLHGISADQLIAQPAPADSIDTAVFDDAAHTQMQELAATIVAAHNPDVRPTQLAYLSAHPSATASAPAWAAGMRVTNTLGPFADTSGTPVWLHAFTLTQSLQFAYIDPSEVFGVFPVNTGILLLPGPQLHLDLGPGSVWFPAPWFAAGAPSDSFTGFQILSGTIDFNMPASVVAGVMVLLPGTTFQFTAQLAPAPSPTPASGPGADANHQTVQTPANVQISFSQNSAQLVSLGDSALTVYGTTVSLHWNNAPPAFASDQITIPCVPNVPTFSFASVLSTLFVPSGSATIASGGWGLAAPETTIPNLGDADGAGFLFLGLGSGVSATWQTHDTPAAFDSLTLDAAAGSITILAASATAKPSSTLIELWDEQSKTLQRKSTVQFTYAKPTQIGFFATASTELLASTIKLNAYLDRPLEADGSRFPLTGMRATLRLFAESTQTRIFLRAAPVAQPSPFNQQLSIAFKNALLGVEPPALLILEGNLQAQTGAVRQCRLTFFFRAFWLLPTLPDPYAASFDTLATVTNQAQENTAQILHIQIQWSGPAAAPVIQLALATPSPQTQNLGLLSTVGLVTQGLSFVLLDLSTQADLLGVKIAADFNRGGDQTPTTGNAPSLGFTDLSVAFNQGFLATFALPQTSWEPMVSEETPAGLITAGLDAADGGPLVLHSINFQQLVPVAPIPVLTSQIANVAAGMPFHASFSLPFGLTVDIEQSNQLVTTANGPTSQLLIDLGDFKLNRPEFPDHGLSGGYQLSLIAPSTPPTPGQTNASFEGAAHVFPFPPGGTPGSPTGYGYDVLGADVGAIFEGEFGDSRVPLPRIDLSGYGASIFSDWREDTTPPNIIKVQFSTIAGRTGYEVVKAQTILYPYCVRLVRTVTIQRQLAGWVDRKDSGWQAATPGEFKFISPAFAGNVHQGGVLGVYNVRNIRDLEGDGNVITATPPPLPPIAGEFLFRKVLFDAEIGIDSRLTVVAGGRVSDILVAGLPVTLVPSRDLVGYVQLSPVYDSGLPPNTDFSPQPAQIASLFAQSGPLTPDLPCVLAIASLSPLPGVGLRCTSVEVNVATNGLNWPALAVAVRGAPQLPRDGAWGVGKRKSKDAAPSLLPPNASVPLVQNATDTSTWHFADTTDVLQLSNPDNIYSFLQSTGTQKVLFEQPTVPQAGVAVGGGSAPGIALPAPPNFGDMGALLNATGLFPDIANTLSLNTGVGEQIENVAGGLKYKKVFTYPLDATTPTGVKQLKLASLDGVFSLDLAYADTSQGTSKPTVITLIIDPTASPRWSISITPLSLLVTLPTFSSTPLLTIIAGSNGSPTVYVDGFIGDENTKPHVTNLNVDFSSALAAIQTVFSRIEAIASFLPGGSAAGLKIALSDGKLTVEDSFALPTLPLGLGELSGISLDLGVAIQLAPLGANFTVGIGSPDNPFNWIVSPLSGNGLVNLGLKNNAPNIDLQAGIGLALAIDLGIASGSAAVVIALNVDINPPEITLMVLLTGQASVDVLDGLTTVSLTLTAGIGVTVDPLPVPTITVLPPNIEFPSETITMLATVSVGIHLSICWVASVDWDGSWQFSESFTTPKIEVGL